MNFEAHIKIRFTLLLVIFFFYACVGFASCTEQKLETSLLTIERAAAEPLPIKVEIARTEAERSRGLMYRKNLSDGEGMLFIFERDDVLSFWMKNTLIPLSIAFIASDGRILEIRNMQPHDLNSIKSSRSVRYALEVPQGWFSRAGVRVGDRLLVVSDLLSDNQK